MSIVLCRWLFALYIINVSLSHIQTVQRSTYFKELIEDIYLKNGLQNLIIHNFNKEYVFPETPQPITLLNGTDFRESLHRDSLVVIFIKISDDVMIEVSKTREWSKFSKLILFIDSGTSSIKDFEPSLYCRPLFEHFWMAGKLNVIVVFGFLPGNIYYLPLHTHAFHSDYENLLALRFPLPQYFPGISNYINDRTLIVEYDYSNIWHLLLFQYRVHNTHSGQLYYGGSFYHFFESFGNTLNLSVDFITFGKPEPEKYSQKIKISRITKPTIETSTVIEYFSGDIIYPLFTEMMKTEIYLAPFDTITWIFIFLMIPCFSLSRYLSSGDRDISKHFLDGMKFFLGQGVRFPYRKTFIFRFFLVLGFLVNTVYQTFYGMYSKVRVVKLNGIHDPRIQIRNFTFDYPMLPCEAYELEPLAWEVLDEIHKSENGNNLKRFPIGGNLDAFFDLEQSPRFHLVDELNWYILKVYLFVCLFV